MLRSPSLPLATKLAVAGMLVLLVGILWSASHYPGGFWPIRNFVSELGWKQHSSQAWAFNAGLTISSLLMFPIIWLFGLRLKSRVSRVATWSGLVTTLAAAGLGFAPMDYLGPHIVLALLFFGGWLLTVSLFAVAFLRQHRAKEAPLFLIVSGLTAAVCAVFLCIVVIGLVIFLRSDVQPADLAKFKRPDVWAIAILEWCIVASLFVWVLSAARFLTRIPNPLIQTLVETKTNP